MSHSRTLRVYTKKTFDQVSQKSRGEVLHNPVRGLEAEFVDEFVFHFMQLVDNDAVSTELHGNLQNNQ
jgi:hypothetical protein